MGANDEALRALYPFMHGDAPAAGRVQQGLLDSVHAKAADSIAVKQAFFARHAEAVIAAAETVAASFRAGRVLLLHALKNASVPIVTVIGIGIALLISGVVITETVFNIPGLGRLTVDAVLKRDYPVVQGLILVFAAAKVLVNLIIDISYAFLDPRIRY